MSNPLTVNGVHSSMESQNDMSRVSTTRPESTGEQNRPQEPLQENAGSLNIQEPALANAKERSKTPQGHHQDLPVAPVSNDTPVAAPVPVISLADVPASVELAHATKPESAAQDTLESASVVAVAPSTPMNPDSLETAPVSENVPEHAQPVDVQEPVESVQDRTDVPLSPPPRPTSGLKRERSEDPGLGSAIETKEPSTNGHISTSPEVKRPRLEEESFGAAAHELAKSHDEKAEAGEKIDGHDALNQGQQGQTTLPDAPTAPEQSDAAKVEGQEAQAGDQSMDSVHSAQDDHPAFNQDSLPKLEGLDDADADADADGDMDAPASPLEESMPPQTPAIGTTSQPLDHYQFRFLTATMKKLVRRKDDYIWFAAPVDYIAHNLPEYPIRVPNPMDLGTVSTKLQASNPAIASDPPYKTADDMIADVHLTFDNCVAFNGPEHIVSLKGKALQSVFDREITAMLNPASAPTRSKPSAIAAPRNSAVSKRPKREVIPSSKTSHDDDYTAISRRKKSSLPQNQKAFMSSLLKDFLHKPIYHETTQWFKEPVDAIRLGIPDYYRVVTEPMDFTTMLHKLNRDQYDNAFAFEDDFRLILRNCWTFNRNPEDLVHQAGQRLKSMFEKRWRNLPALGAASYSQNDYYDDDADLPSPRFNNNRNQMAAMPPMSAGLNNQYSLMQQQMALLQENFQKQIEMMQQAFMVAAASGNAAAMAAPGNYAPIAAPAPIHAPAPRAPPKPRAPRPPPAARPPPRGDELSDSPEEFMDDFDDDEIMAPTSRRERKPPVKKAPAAPKPRTDRSQPSKKSRKSRPAQEEDEEYELTLDQQIILSQALDACTDEAVVAQAVDIVSRYQNLDAGETEINLEMTSLPKEDQNELFKLMMRNKEREMRRNPDKKRAIGGYNQTSVDEQEESDKIRKLQEKYDLLASGGKAEPKLPETAPPAGEAAPEADAELDATVAAPGPAVASPIQAEERAASIPHQAAPQNETVPAQPAVLPAPAAAPAAPAPAPDSDSGSDDDAVDSDESD